MRSAIRAIAAIVLIPQIVSDYAPARERVERVKRPPCKNAPPCRVIRNFFKRIERPDGLAILEIDKPSTRVDC